MMNKFGKFGRAMLTLSMCAALVVSGVSLPESDTMVYAATQSEYEAWAANGDINSAKSAALTDLKDYYTTLIVGLSASTKKEVKKLYSEYKQSISNVQAVSNVYPALQAAETALADKAKGTDEGANSDAGSDSDSSDKGSDNNSPSSSSDLIMVGGNWVTPTARYGQYVSVVLPVVNMMQGINLTNVIVTPIVATNTNDWPFEIETSGYTQTIPDLPGAGNGQSDMDRRRELTWNFKVKDNVLNGYYKVPFLVNYIDPTTGENVQVTLTTYVLAVGAPGAGMIDEDTGKYSTPRVIVSGYDTDPKEVYAGDTFTLTLHLTNTSANTSVSNMLVHLTAPTEGTDSDSSYSAFMPSSGSNTFYVDKIAKGGTKDLTIEMKAKNDLSPKPYSLDVNMDYEDENINSYTSSSDISIQVKQNARFEFSSIEIIPTEINVGDQTNVMFSIYNTGQVTLYNVHVSFEADSIEADETYLGKIETGGTGSVDTMVTGVAPTEDDGTVKVILTYEDENADKYTYEENMTLTVNEVMMADDSMLFDDMGEMDEESQGPNKALIVAIIVVCLIIIVVVVIIVLKKHRKKKEEEELVNLLEDELDETDGKDDSDEIS
jgi:hypothetical protein